MNKIIETLCALQHAAPDGLNLSRGITELRAQVPAPILAHFDRQVARGKKGVAEARNGVCSSCHLRLPASLIAGNNDVQLCENCGAYVMFPAQEAPAATKTARPPRRYRAGAPA